MFKFVVLSALVALSAAAPSGLIASPWASQVYAHQPIVAKQIVESHPVVSHYSQPEITGSIVQNVPTAVSHQSQSIVHHDNIVTPIVSQVQKSVVSSVPVVKTIAAPGPITYSAAPVWSHAPIAHAHSPLSLSAVHSPLAYESVHSPLAYNSVHSPLAYDSVHSPLALSHGWNAPLSSW